MKNALIMNNKSMNSKFINILSINYDENMVGFSLFDVEKGELLVGQDLPDTIDSDIIRSFAFRFMADIILFSTNIGKSRYETIKDLNLNLRVVPKTFFGNLNINTEITTNRKLSFSCLKCLLKYIEGEFPEYVDLSKQKINISELDNAEQDKEYYIGRYDNIKVKIFNNKDYLFLDPLTIKSLDLVTTNIHPNLAIKGQIEQSSVFSYINNCQTQAGIKKLKTWLLFPLNNLELIKKRHIKIENVLNNDLVAKLQSLLKKIKTFSHLFNLTNSKSIATYFTKIYEFLSISREIILAFKNFKEKNIFVEIKNEIKRCFLQKTRTESVICEEYDSELDYLIKIHKNLSMYLDEIAIKISKEYNVNACIIYFPQIGYCIETYSVIPQLYLLFVINSNNYFKNDFMRRLDIELGDVVSKIAERERLCGLNLRNMIEKHSDEFILRVDEISEIDCIVSLAILAQKNNMKKPELLVNGNSQFLMSNFKGLAKNENFIPININILKTTILLGNNASGKSSTLRSIGQCIVLAQMGSFLPCNHANLSIFDRIFTKIGTNESISSGKSSFISDLIQLSYAERYSTSNSIFLCDEFGKGTNIHDGFSLLVSTIKNVSNPLSIFATHFHEFFNNEIKKYLSDYDFITIKNFEFNYGILYESNVRDLLEKHRFDKEFINLFEDEKEELKKNEDKKSIQNIQWAKDILNKYISEYKINIALYLFLFYKI